MSLYFALDAALYNYQNQYISININKKIISNNGNLFLISKELMKKISPLYDLIYDKNKKEILFEKIKEKELVDIINIIYELKKIINSDNYIEIILKITNLVDIIKKLLKEKKFQNVINGKNTIFLKEMWKKINKLPEIKNELNKTKNIFNAKIFVNNKKEIIEKDKNNITNNKKSQNIENSTIDLSKKKLETQKIINNENVKLNDNNISELKKIIDINIFDNLYLDIIKKCIDKNNNKENKIFFKMNSNIKLIFANYFFKNFQMKSEQDYLYLGGDEIEKTINAFNSKFTKIKKKLIDI